MSHFDLDLAERASVSIRLGGVSGRVSLALEREEVGFWPPLGLGRDIRRQLGEDGFEVWRELMFEFEPRFSGYVGAPARAQITPEQYKAGLIDQWQRYGQGEMHWTDMMLVDAMASARADGWKIADDMLLDDGAPARVATEAILDDLARRSGAKRAAIEADWKARDDARIVRAERCYALDDAAYDQWLEAGGPDGPKARVIRWKERRVREDEAIARYDARCAQQIKTPLMSGMPMSGNSPVPM